MKKLNDDFEKLAKNIRKNPRKDIEIKKHVIFLYVGLRIALILFFFIFIGEWIRKTYGFKFAMPIALLLAIISVAVVFVDIYRKIKNDDS